MDDRDLAFTPAWRLKEMIDSKEVSPVELTELYLRRIDDLNPQLNAYLTVVGDMALEWARDSENAVVRGEPLGPLHGVPISIKDLNATKGIRTTNGSLIFKDWVPDADDIVTERIRKSGAIILGKTNTPELGHKGSTENRLGDPCRNPWDLSRTPGGSSGGAAAGQVAGLSALSQGSDGGGSIRIPASFCGLYGIKPTQGRVPSVATGPGGWGQLGQSGPITSNVRDAALLLQVLSGPDSRDPGCVRTEPPDFSNGLNDGVKGLRIAWTPDFGSAAVDPGVHDACERAAKVFEEMGATVETTDFHIDIDDAIDLLETIMWTDRTANSGHLLADHADDMSTTFREPLERAMNWTAQKVAFALRRLEWHRLRMTQVFERYDLLLSPTMAVPAFTIGELPKIIGDKEIKNPVWGFNPFNFLINMSRQTAASIPCGFSQDGLPIGLHIIGDFGQESLVLKASAAYEEAKPWAGKRPPIS
jgi:aspartyl-tRNA(Asn)/glutamyl-tRNA(Gln) amidotransferase subunit A